MINVRRAEERFHSDAGWLDSRHTFSFADHYDPRYTGFRTLRVINEDKVAAGAGFPSHPHRDMEIISYVLSGALEHKDSMGNGSVIRPGELQRMSAGTGVTHSEKNASASEPVHFLQIWLLPERRGVAPSYEQRAFPAAGKDALHLIASRNGDRGAIRVHQDVELYRGVLEPGQKTVRELATARNVWLQVVRGDVALNGTALSAGDGAAVTQERAVQLVASSPAEVLLFDLA
jgi:quercetin 2,3-dioxygenase